MTARLAHPLQLAPAVDRSTNTLEVVVTRTTDADAAEVLDRALDGVASEMVERALATVTGRRATSPTKSEGTKNGTA